MGILSRCVHRPWRARRALLDFAVITIAAGEIVVICGLMGARKSAFAVQHFLNQRESVLTNIPLLDPPDHVRVVADMNPAYLSASNCLIIWDEAGAACCTMQRAALDRLCAWAATIRHRQISLVLVCQNSEQIDRRLLFLTSKTIRLVDISSRLGSVFPALNCSSVQCFSGYRYTHQLEGKTKKYGRLWARRYAPDAAVFALFNSVDFGDAVRHHQRSALFRLMLWGFPLLFGAIIAVAAFNNPLALLTDPLAQKRLKGHSGASGAIPDNVARIPTFDDRPWFVCRHDRRAAAHKCRFFP